MVVKRDGSVWVTGMNEHGRLGDGSTTGKSSFEQMVSGGVKAVAAGLGHTMVLKQDDSVWTTGWNIKGQLGDGSIISKKDFAQVIGT